MIADDNGAWWFAHWTEAMGYWRDLIAVTWKPATDGCDIAALTLCSIVTSEGRLLLFPVRGPWLPSAVEAAILQELARRTCMAPRLGTADHYMNHDWWSLTYSTAWADPSEYHGIA